MTDAQTEIEDTEKKQNEKMIGAYAPFAEQYVRLKINMRDNNS